MTAAGASFDDVVKATVFLTDLSHFALVNKIMAEYFRQPYPARAAVGVASLPRGAPGRGGMHRRALRVGVTSLSAFPKPRHGR